jgi:glycerophosphoryl diester phosphodiesterase
MAHPWVIGHRGASAHAPENTLEAFRRAVELGASGIETDVRMTRDGRFVLLHDARVNRTTDGSGSIDQLGLDAARKLDAGSWFGEEFAGERVPTLEEAIDLGAKLNVWLYLELKLEIESAMAYALVDTLRRARRLERVVLLSFDAATLDLLRSTDPRVLTGLLAGRSGPTIEAARRAGARLLAPNHQRITPRMVRRAHEAGLAVVAWTVNARREMRRLLEMDVDGIMTDWPDRLIETIGRTATAEKN